MEMGRPTNPFAPPAEFKYDVITTRVDDQERFVRVNVVPYPTANDFAERRVGFDLKLPGKRVGAQIGNRGIDCAGEFVERQQKRRSVEFVAGRQD